MKDQAIALCRVSTPEQKDSNSLNRQGESVSKAAIELDVKIIRQWSGDVSSKVGKNYRRKDLLEAYDFCKSNKRVRYFIVDEVDRFMRSVAEMFYWITKFKEEVGVQVYFASNPELNSPDARSRLLLSLDGFKAEGSNEERQRKSINGHAAAIKDGRYTFPPKPGYAAGTEPGVHVPHPVTFKPLQKAYREVVSGLYTPLEAMKRLNEGDFTKDHAPWKMDKFRQFAIDPYYAGILEIDRQVKARNEYGRHEKMLTKEEHERLLEIFTGTVKVRGTKKQYNPEFPMNKIMTCEDCGNEVKFTGSIKNNGYARKTTSHYYKYHCRGCGKAYHRDEVHGLIAERLQEIQYTGSQQDEFTEALEIVWRQKQQDKLQGVNALQKRLDELQRTKSKLVVEMVKADPKYKADIEQGVDGVKANIASIEDKISSLNKLDDDLAEFLKFGLDYTTNLVEDWWELEHEDRVRCQQLVFPGGISFNADKKVGTSQLSALYSLKPNKKDLRNDRKSLLEELIQDNWHPIELELGHWREVLAIPWMRAKNNYVP